MRNEEMRKNIDIVGQFKHNPEQDGFVCIFFYKLRRIMFDVLN